MGKINTLLSLDGETQFKRALHDINNNLKTLGKEFTSLQSDLSGTTNKMDQASRTSANLKAQIDFLTQKHDLLTAAVQRAEAEVLKSKDALTKAQVAYGAHGQKLTEAQKAYEQSSQKIKNLESKLKSVGSATATITLQGQQWKRELEQERAAQQKSIQEIAKLKEEQKQLANQVSKAEKAVEKNVDTVHKYSQMLADNDTQLHKTETEQRRFNETATDTSKKVNQEVVDIGKLASGVKQAATGFAELSAAMAKAEFKAISGTFQAITKEIELGFQGLKKYTEAFTAAATAVGGFAITNGIAFEKSMSNVKAYSQASTDDMDRLSEAAKEMGATTSKTAAEAADALGYLALNGYSVEEMLTTLKPVVKASEAGNMDLATTAQQTAVALRVYGKGAEDAEEFLNILTATQNNSATSLNELLTAFTSLSGTFNMLHLDFKESATIMGLMANQGISGAEAGTSLNSVFLRLLETNKNSASAFDRLGVSAYNSEGEIRNMYDIVNDLSTAMSGLTAQEKIAVSKDIFGVYRFKEGMKFLDALSDVDKYSNLYDITSSAFENNYLYNTADIMMDNLKGKVTILKSATEALGISIFETFSDRAVQNVKRFTQWINILNEGVQNGDVKGAIEEVGKFMTGAVVRTINQVKNELPGKLSIFNAFILESVDVLIRAMRESKTKIVPKLIKGARDLVLGLIDRLPDFLTELTDGALIMFTGIVDALDKISVKLVEKLPEIIKIFGDALTGDQAGHIFETGFQVLMNLLNAVVENLPTIMMYASKLLQNICKGIRDHVSEIAAGAVAIINALVDFISDEDNLKAILDTGGAILTAVVNAIIEGEVLKKLLKAALEILGTIGQYLLDNSEKIFKDYIPDVIDELSRQLGSQENQDVMDKVGQTLGEALIKGLKYALQGIVKIGVSEAGRGLGIVMAKAYGLEGTDVDMMGETVSQIMKAQFETQFPSFASSSSTSSKVAEATEKTEKLSKDQYWALERATYQQWEQGYTYQGLNNDGSLATFINESQGGKIHIVQLNSPVFNNVNDIEQTMESIAQYSAAAVAGGGKY